MVELRPTRAAGDDAAGPPDGWARCLRQDQLHLAGASAAPDTGTAPAREGDAPVRPVALSVHALAKRFPTRSGVAGG